MDLVKPGARPHKAVNYIGMKPWPRINEVITSGEPAGKVALAKTQHFYVIFDFMYFVDLKKIHIFKSKLATMLYFGSCTFSTYKFTVQYTVLHRT